MISALFVAAQLLACSENSSPKSPNADAQKKIDSLLPLARAGNADAQFRLGFLFASIEGEEFNFEGTTSLSQYTEAAYWTRMAAEQGHAYAQYFWGEMLRYGPLGPTNTGETVKWIRLTAEQQLPVAQYAMGKLFEDAYGVSRDYEQARDWYLRAAENGETLAYIALGDLYLSGKGVSSDYEKSLNYYVRSGSDSEVEIAIARISLNFQVSPDSMSPDLSLAYMWAEVGHAIYPSNSTYKYFLKTLAAQLESNERLLLRDAAKTCADSGFTDCLKPEP